MKFQVLVVEDDDGLRELAAWALESKGYTVALAADGLEAWELLAGQNSYDAVLTDIQMPRMDGLELLRKMREDSRFKDLPVIVHSSTNDPATKAQVFELGAEFTEKNAYQSYLTPLAALAQR